MNKLTRISLLAATFAVCIALGGGATAMAQGGGSSGSWPLALPLPTTPGTVIAQTPTTAVVRSADPVANVRYKLEEPYLTQLGCSLRLTVNRPKDYLCHNPATGKTDEVYFTFAALDPTAVDPSRSQTNAFLVKG